MVGYVIAMVYKLFVACVVIALFLIAKIFICDYLPLHIWLYKNNLYNVSRQICPKDHFTSMMFTCDEDWLINVYDSLNVSRETNYRYGKYSVLAEKNRLFMKIVENGGIDYTRDHRGDLQDNFLHTAVDCQNEELVTHMVERYPHLKYDKDVRGNIPLHYAMYHNNLNIIIKVADERAKNTPDRNGHKAYQRAAYRAIDPTTVCLLLPKGEKVERESLRALMLDTDSAWSPNYFDEIEAYLDRLTCGGGVNDHPNGATHDQLMEPPSSGVPSRRPLAIY